MSRRREQVAAAVGVVAFLGAMVVWLLLGGDRARAGEGPLLQQTHLVSASKGSPVLFHGQGQSELTLVDQRSGRISRVELSLVVTCERSDRLGLTLTSPSGTQVVLAEALPCGARRAWQWEGGAAPGSNRGSGTLADFLGELAGGPWQLEVRSGEPGTLASWGMTAEVSPSPNRRCVDENDTCCMYICGPYCGWWKACPPPTGCDCNLGRGSGRSAGGPLALVLLVAAALLTARRRPR